MTIMSNLFEITQFCLLHFILLFAYLSVLLKPHFLQSDQYTWFSHAQSHSYNAHTPAPVQRLPEQVFCFCPTATSSPCDSQHTVQLSSKCLLFLFNHNSVKILAASGHTAFRYNSEISTQDTADKRDPNTQENLRPIEHTVLTEKQNKSPPSPPNLPPRWPCG